MKCLLPRWISLAIMDGKLYGYIAMYAPEEGNYEHWALYLEHGGDVTNFQVTGQSPNFERDVFEGVDQLLAQRFRRRILVGTICQKQLQKLRRSIETVAVDNETSHWNCQDHVMEALDRLRQEGVIDEDDEDYEAGREEAMEYYGPSDIA